MSDKQKNGSPTGKSLAIMQQRLLSKTDSEEARGTPMPPPPGGPGQQPTTQAAAATSAAPPGRPKGKDFAAMAMNAKASSPPAPAPAPPTAPTTASPAPVAPNRPKGKDFSAMANRMPQQPVHPLDPDRAAKMQAEARAAAGLPPLVQPTATSVTMVPPPIAAPGVPGPKGPTPMTIDPRRQQQSIPVARQEANRAVPQQAVRRNAMTRPPPAPAAATSVAVPQPPKPTAQPTPAEARLSLAAGTLGARPGGPHQSPLVGQRLRDLVASLDPNYVLDSQAEEQVLQLADDFLDKVTRQAIRLAQHRGSRTLDVQDVQLALSKQWGIVVPGLGPPVLRPTKPANRAPAAAGTKRRSSSKEGGAAKKAKTTATKLS